MLHVLDSEAPPAPAAHDRAIVTLCIGDRHRVLWDRLSRDSWLGYGARHGYDIVQVVAPLDVTATARARSPAWQKCLVPVQPWARRYRRIVWMDADIIVAEHAPDVAAAQPDPTRIGLCATGAQLSRAELHVYLERFHRVRIAPAQLDQLWGMHIGNQFGAAGIAPDAATMFNTGVMVLSPAHHAGLLQAVYARDEPDNPLYEQPALSLAICRRAIAAPLSARFNWNLHEAAFLRYAADPKPPLSEQQVQSLYGFMRDELDKAYFLHFCGCMPLLALLAGGPAALTPSG